MINSKKLINYIVQKIKMNMEKCQKKLKKLEKNIDMNNNNSLIINIFISLVMNNEYLNRNFKFKKVDEMNKFTILDIPINENDKFLILAFDDLLNENVRDIINK